MGTHPVPRRSGRVQHHRGLPPGGTEGIATLQARLADIDPPVTLVTGSIDEAQRARLSCRVGRRRRSALRRRLTRQLGTTPGRRGGAHLLVTPVTSVMMAPTGVHPAHPPVSAWRSVMPPVKKIVLWLLVIFALRHPGLARRRGLTGRHDLGHPRQRHQEHRALLRHPPQPVTGCGAGACGHYLRGIACPRPPAVTSSRARSRSLQCASTG